MMNSHYRRPLSAAFSSLAFLLVCVVLAACKSNINSMKGVSVVESDKETGLTVFRTDDSLYGVADAGGDVVIEAEYGEITLYGSFVKAKLSDRTFKEETDRMIEESGAREDWKPGDDVKELKHEYLVAGYDNVYYRLFTADGTMIKDYSRGGTAFWTSLMGDSIIWKSNLNVDKDRDCLQLINADGETTDIKDFNVTPSAWGYTTEDGTSHTFGANGREMEMWGRKVGEEPGFIITKGTASDPDAMALNVFTTGGEYCYFEGYDPIAYLYDDEGKGLFIKALEGEEVKGESRAWRTRPQKFFYVTPEGKVTDIPEGYTVRNPYGNDLDLYNPEGQLMGYGWRP